MLRAFPSSDSPGDSYFLQVLRTLRLAGLCTPEPRRVFRCLTILRIDLTSPSNFFNLNPESLQCDMVHVFVSPTLREITLRDATLTQLTTSYLNQMRYENFTRETPLQVLRLPNCYVDANTLKLLLTLPRALEVFHLQPGSDTDRSRSVVLRSLACWMDVFMLQQHTLEEIAILTQKPSGFAEEVGGPLDLRAMPALSKVAGDVFREFPEKLKRPDHAEVVGSAEYKRSLADTRGGKPKYDYVYLPGKS